MIAAGRDCADILRLALAKVDAESRVRSMIDAARANRPAGSPYFTGSPVSVKTSFPLRGATSRL